MAGWVGLGDAAMAAGTLQEADAGFLKYIELARRTRDEREVALGLSKTRRRAGGAGQSAGGAEIVPGRASHCRPSGQGRPRQRRIAARPVGVLRKDRRRAGGAGQSSGGAEIVPRRAGHCRSSGQARPSQRRLAARPAFGDGLAFAERLAKADPGNAVWQRDLSVSHAKLASAYLRAGQSAKAGEALAAGRARPALQPLYLAPVEAVVAADILIKPATLVR